ncbi:MAG TPA: hypothetical protein VL172_20190 [Kofleriaceae bacterium]|nr:hypothetical protein [Kofleriaceae bacterium]
MKQPITIDRDSISFGDTGLRVTFQRTLRIPDDGREYPLPPGLGAFPIRRVDDYRDRVPAAWREQGGVFLPMYQREAMWILFQGPHWKPHAVKVAVGKVCALTGRPWSESLHSHPQDYLVTPPQPWLDGICAGKGFIRQFVAMPLGLGYTVEGQVTGEERFGGIQIKLFPPRPGRFPDEPPRLERARMSMACAAPAPGAAPQASAGRAGASMGLAAGGRMRQKIYPDTHGVDTWLPDGARVFVHIVNSELWREITGEAPPASPVTAREYARCGLPWFDLYDEHAATLEPTPTLAGVKSIKELDDEPVEPGPIKKLWHQLTGQPVRDGDW